MEVIREKTEERPVLVWDTCEIAQRQAEFLMERAKEDGEELTEEVALEDAWGDSDIYDFEYECMCDELFAIMEEVQKESGLEGEDWVVGVDNFGWRNTSGIATFKNLVDSNELLQKVLPDCECTYKIYKRDNMIVINNAHHDSPCWKEWYYIKPVKICEYCDNMAIASMVEYQEAVCKYHLEVEIYKEETINAKYNDR